MRRGWMGVALLMGCPDKQPTIDTVDTGITEDTGMVYTSAEDCESCHSLQYEEWAGSAMHMAASPTYAAFEIAMNRASNGSFAHGSGTGNENFCNSCHVNIGVQLDQLPLFDASDPHAYPGPLEGLSDLAMEGVTCDVCHLTTGIDPSKTPNNDGLGNGAALVHDPDGVRQGPFADPLSLHAAEENAFLSSSAFCGTCHDVRSGKPDALTGEGFTRVENTYTEWLESGWSGTDNPMGTPVTCQDCHMSLYPFALPGTRPDVRVASYPSDLPEREHALHAFTAVSTSLNNDPRYPNQDEPGVMDDFGFPVGQAQRREAMLQAACTLRLDDTPTLIAPGASTLPVVVTIENVGAGHGVPSGFSQEREVWVELVVSDDSGVLYQSGVLEDSSHPETGETQVDGLLDDEDLQHRYFSVDLDTLQATVTPGPDADQRGDGINLGLVSLTNDFVYVDPKTGESRVVFTPIEANAADNTHALGALETRSWQYDVPLPAGGIQGEITVSARLRFRAFPPKFLRLLSQISPDLVTEEMVDNNLIVDMAEDALRVRLQ